MKQFIMLKDHNIQDKQRELARVSTRFLYLSIWSVDYFPMVIMWHYVSHIFLLYDLLCVDYISPVNNQNIILQIVRNTLKANRMIVVAK